MDFTTILLKDEPVAGVEVGDSAIRLVLAKRNKHTSKIEISLFIEQPLEKGVVYSGQILNAERFTEALFELRKKVDKHIHYVIVSISPEHTYSKVFSFPSTIHGPRLEESINLAINYQLPMAAKDIYADRQILSEGETIQVYVVAALRENVDPLIKAFSDANFSLVAVERFGHSLHDALGSALGGAEGVVIKMPTADSTQIFVYINQALYFVRTLPNIFVSAERQQAEIKNLLDYLEVEYKIHPKVLEYEQLTLREDVFVGSENPRPWLIAIGAALRGLRPLSQDKETSLMPVSTQQAYQFKKAIQFSQFISRLLAAAAVFFVLAFAGVYAFMNNLQKSAAKQIEAINVQLPQNSIDAENKISHVNSLVAVASTALRARPEWSRLLTELNSRVTPGILITNAAFSQPAQPMTITGVAATRGELNDFKKSLDDSSMIAAVNLPLNNLDLTANIPFTITFSLQNPNSIYSQ